MSGAPSRQERQRAELRRLCAEGSVTRAVDLAFEHFADFGLTDDLVVVLADALERTAAPAAVRRRLAELRATRDEVADRVPVRSPHAHRAPR